MKTSSLILIGGAGLLAWLMLKKPTGTTTKVVAPANSTPWWSTLASAVGAPLAKGLTDVANRLSGNDVFAPNLDNYQGPYYGVQRSVAARDLPASYADTYNQVGSYYVSDSGTIIGGI